MPVVKYNDNNAVIDNDARLGSIVFANDFSNAAYGRDTDVKNQKPNAGWPMKCFRTMRPECVSSPLLIMPF